VKKISDQVEQLDELENLVADFIELNRELVDENQVLREKQKKLISANSDLERRAEEARSRVSAVIERLQKH
tara:strand:+ start:170 stop:382 length:213 start_codon:yes stop_codon:yes gene_type:complete